MLRIRPRTSRGRRYFWMFKQVWKYIIFMYLAFTCFYLYNLAFQSQDATSHKRKHTKKRNQPTLPPVNPEEDPAENNDFLKMFPDPELNLNPQQIRRKKQQMRELQNQQLEKKRRQQIENEHKFQEKARQLKFLDRIRLLEDLKAYEFPSAKTKKRVELISKIRWQLMTQESVEMKGFGIEPNPPYDIHDHFRKLRKVLNTEQSVEISYKPFSLHRPAFASDVDRIIFLKNKVNEEAMRSRPEEQFKGYIDVYKDALVSSQIGCSYKNSRRLFIEYTADDDDVQVIGKAVCPLLIPKSFEFQHFVIEVLPKIMQAYDLILSSDISLLIHEPRDENILLLLDKLGIDRDRLVFHKRGLWKVKTVVDTCITPPFHPALFKTARRAMGTHENLTVPMEDAYIILLLPEDYEEGRIHIINKAELTGVMYNRYGAHLKLVRQATSVSTSVEMFKHARIIIGIHGEALYNILFAPSGTHIIEIMPMDKSGNVCGATEKVPHESYWTLSAMLNQKYWRLVEEPKQTKCDMKVNIEKLLKILGKIDERQNVYQPWL